MNIIPKEKIAEAIERSTALHGDKEKAIEAVAQSLHLAPETVRECVEAERESTC